MAGGDSSKTWVVVHETGVRQSPSQSSALLFHAQPGKQLTQCGKSVFVPDCGLRIPVLPRGWIDRSALKQLGEPDEPESALIQQAGGEHDFTQSKQAQQAVDNTDDAIALYQYAEQHTGDWNQNDGWWQGGYNRRSTYTASTREQWKQEALAAWQDQTASTELQETGSHVQGGWNTPWYGDQIETWEQNSIQKSGYKSNGVAAPNTTWRPRAPQSGTQESRPTLVSAFSDAQLRFSGRLKFGEETDACAMIESAEVAHLFGIGRIEPQGPWPDDLQQTRDQIVCFAVEEGDSMCLAKVTPGSLCRAAAASSFVGTVKAVNQQKSTGWISCLAAQQLYGCDVYLYLGVGMGLSGADMSGLRHGDVVGFAIHVNKKGKPQASTGSVVLLRSVIPGRSSSEGGAGMDATVLQVGQVVSVEYSQNIRSLNPT